MRCRTLARELQRHGAEVCFLCRRQSGDLISLLKQEFVVLVLPEQSLAACEGLEGRELYASWLGCTQEQDAAECLEILVNAGINSLSWLVADHYGIDIRWEAQILAGLADRDVYPKLLVIDDLADRKHQSDLLLDQNFFGSFTQQRYQDLIPPMCRQLLGPHYALLGPEYARLHTLVPPRSEVRRVMVFFGGVDQDNLTVRALEALSHPALNDLVVDVVLGLQSPHRKAVEELVAARPHTTLHDVLPSLAGLITRADVAIGAGGVTTLERACLGLPSLVVVTALNQLPSTKALDQAGYLHLLGYSTSVSTEQIRSALLLKFAQLPVGQMCPALGDGWGTQRMVLTMLSLQSSMKLRSALSTDEALLLHWANDPQVRANSFSSETILADDHHRWFQEGLLDPNRLMLIATTADDCPIGQIRFDRQPVSADGVSFEAKLHLSLDRSARGQGLSAEMVRLGLQAILHHWGPDISVVAEVLACNTASNACFARVGFARESVYNLPCTSPSGVILWRWRPTALPVESLGTGE